MSSVILLRSLILFYVRYNYIEFYMVFSLKQNTLFASVQTVFYLGKRIWKWRRVLNVQPMISPQFCMKYHSFAHRSKRENAEISKDEKEVSDVFACLMFHILFCCKLACYFKASRVLVTRRKKLTTWI